ncbi:MAG: MarR family winged helix-turn-helix transcriptional regulator [Epsilonproteobacteria bacterium]|nr:MarR family winged helix-turn-helix transcriptional regulator [Campylobacterota bacterium]
MKTTLIYTYIERLSNLLKNEQRLRGTSYGLQPVQIEALHYLSICNRYSNTPKSVTEYLGQTKGTVSQSLKILEQKGFLSKHQNQADKRITHLMLTQKGIDTVDAIIPPPLFIETCKVLNEQEQIHISDNLNLLLKTLQKTQNMKSFGVCATCQYITADHDGDSFCTLTEEKLSPKDTTLICHEHSTEI